MRPYIIISYIFLLSCSSQNTDQENFDNLSGLVDMMDSNNRLYFLPIAESYYDKGDQLETISLSLFHLLDSAFNDILIATGGYNTNGILVFGSKKGIASKVFMERDIFKRIINEKLQLEELSKQDSLDASKLDFIYHALHTIEIYNRPNKDFHDVTSTEALMNISTIQNKLLMVLLL